MSRFEDRGSTEKKDEDLLHEIVSLSLMPENPACYVPNDMGMSTEQMTQCFSVPFCHLFQQRFVCVRGE
jgi:hypothetical protein